MAKKKIFLGMLVMVLVSGITVAGCGGANRLQGTWRQEGPWEGEEVIITYNFSRGTVTVTHSEVDEVYTQTGTYVTSGNNITITFEGISSIGTFFIEGNILVINFQHFGGHTVKFTRQR